MVNADTVTLTKIISFSCQYHTHCKPKWLTFWKYLTLRDSKH